MFTILHAHLVLPCICIKNCSVRLLCSVHDDVDVELTDFKKGELFGVGPRVTSKEVVPEGSFLSRFY